MRHYVNFPIPGYESLIIKPVDVVEAKRLPCAGKRCNKERTLLKSGKYDPYCRKCRSIINKKHRTKNKRPVKKRELWGHY